MMLRHGVTPAEVLGTKVFVYFNLHKKVWSLRALDGRAKGKVIAHSPYFVVTEAEFRVSEAGRQRVLREQRKNVHAGVVGYLYSLSETPAVAQGMSEDAEGVRYNPYATAHFKGDGGRHVARAAIVAGIGRRVCARLAA
jgi:hypothetical protein